MLGWGLVATALEPNETGAAVVAFMSAHQISFADDWTENDLVILTL